MSKRHPPPTPLAHENTMEDPSQHSQTDAASYLSAPSSPATSRRPRSIMSRRPSNSELAHGADERTPLLMASSGRSRKRIASAHDSPRAPHLSRHHSTTAVRTDGFTRHHNRANSWGERLMQALADRQESLVESKVSSYADERVWYDQFTSTDWVHDSIADAYRVKALRSRKGFWGHVYVLFDGAQGWILTALVGVIVAVIAYLVDVSEAIVFDLKDGYCKKGVWLSEKKCCPRGPCTDWRDWGEVAAGSPLAEHWGAEFAIYVCFVVLFASLACLLTLLTKTVVPSAYRLITLDENLAAEHTVPSDPAFSDADHAEDASVSPRRAVQEPTPPMVYYSAAGSGVAEVRVILSGFVLHGFLGLKTLIIKTVGMVLSVGSGLSLGKEGPYVHIATCVGNIACRLFSKYDKNDGKRREIMSAAAAAGVAVAFGAPISGVLFSLEEVAYFFPAKTLFRTFFCCITAALTLKFLNPYGTHKIVMFQVHYAVDWEYFELGSFILVGILGGAAGALFIKASARWAKTFRKIHIVKAYPLVEVILVAVVTGLVGYWNPLTKLPVAKLLYNLAAPCDDRDDNLEKLGLCPKEVDDIPDILATLLVAFLIKGVLTIVTFGIKVPAGIYVPSMVVGGLMGRLIGHIVQWSVMKFPHWSMWGTCAVVGGGSTCIQPGVYALIAAGSTMCGVTRLSVTLAVILFELTGSLDYVLPFSLAILVAKWTADAIEPSSIYDLLTEMNSYPYLNNKHKPVFTSELADIVPRVRRERVIDITSSPLVPAPNLRTKLELLHKAGELDGGLPIIRDDILVGLIPAPDLEFALDNLVDEGSAMCLMANVPTIEDDDDGENGSPFDDGRHAAEPADLTPYIDPAPVALDIHSPMDLVYECFVKLGLRYICILRDGRYAGMTHKKRFVRYIRELEDQEGHH